MPVSTLLSPFTMPFMQTAAAEVAVLAFVAGIVGPQVVARRLGFLSHALGAGAFPGLVVAAAVGLPAQLAALATGGLMAGALNRLVRHGRVATDAATAIVLVVSLATGVVLASNVFTTTVGVDRLLFGSLLSIDNGDVRNALIATAAIGLVAAACWRTWRYAAFDFQGARAAGRRVSAADWALLACVAVAVVVTLDAVGSLLVTALLVVPAATAWITGVRDVWLAALTTVIALVEGLVGIRLAYELDIPPGAAVAVIAAAGYLAVAGYSRLRRSARADAAASAVATTGRSAA